MATTEVAQEAIGYVGVTHEEMDNSKVQTFVHTEHLTGDANDLWEACKHAVALLPDLAPEYFAKAEFAQGSGAPGSIGVFHFGPGTNLVLLLKLVLFIVPQKLLMQLSGVGRSNLVILDSPTMTSLWIS